MSVCNGILSVFLSKVRNLTSRSFSQYVECVLKPNTLQTVSCIFTIHYRLGHLVATPTGRRVCVDIEICMYIECNNSHVGYICKNLNMVAGVRKTQMVTPSLVICDV